MGKLLGLLIVHLVPRLKNMFLSLLGMLGVGFISYQGITQLGNYMLSFISDRWGELPLEAVGILNLAGVGTGMSILLSSYSVMFSMSVARKVLTFFERK